MTRSTTDLINELKSEQERFSGVVLVVGFEKSSQMVSPEDPKALSNLNEYVQNDGTPVGFIGWDMTEPGVLQMYTRPLEELKSEAWAQGFLSALCTQVQVLLKAKSWEHMPKWKN